MENPSWDEIADVVVVGGGGAGVVTAITAHDAGAKVIILEKGECGGNTRLATMAFLCPTNSLEAREHIKALSLGEVPDDVIDAYVEWASRNVDYIKELGGVVETCYPGASFPALAGAETMLRYRVQGRTESELGGESLWNLLSENLRRRSVLVYEDTPAVRILRSGDEVVGVEAERDGRRFTVGARRAVVLATGGFEYNEDMKREFLAGYPIWAYGHRGNTGDGIKMAQELGADLWHTRGVAAPMGYKFPEFEAAFIMRMPADGYIMVDQYGQRFCNETGLEHYSMWMAVTSFDVDALCFTRIPAYLIFDEQTRLKGPITRVGHGANRDYRWSMDNSAEVRRGWIAAADDPYELASKLGIKTPGNLAKTVEAYLKACRDGTDPQFRRTKESLVPLEGKYFGVPVWPCLLNTQGGPRRNAKGQIMDVRGKPIKRLYGVGEVGSIWGLLYQSGGNLGECLGLGRMVALNAAAELPLN